MKRAILILLALVMVLSLAACGAGSVDENEQSNAAAEEQAPLEDQADSILRSETWIDLKGIDPGPDMTFLDGGIMKYGSSLFDWELKGTTIRIEGTDNSIILGNATVNNAYTLEEENHIYKLTSVLSNSIYVRESDYETALDILEIPDELRLMNYDEIMENASSGNLESMMVKGHNNPAEAEDDYLGNIYIVSGVVWNINPDHSVSIKPGGNESIMGFFTIYFVNDEDILSLSSGDAIVVVGRITQAGVFFEMKNAYLAYKLG